ncbi:PhzF family phenazine biosynthesis protein [Candidatus Bipolaricaulota bacterium]|nr:PhzF family phenazine biosynthesis protein [Candidatus Bipolaricaulota bacterium]
MSIPIYQVDAFTEKPFAGNPAGVCILEQPADEAWMQALAMEMNLSETAFVMRRDDGDFDLRWFTPAVEVALCGHATLATSHILWETGILRSNEVAHYHTQSGLLTARLVDNLVELDFPATPPVDCETPRGLLEALGLESAVYVGQPRFDYLVEVAFEDIVRALSPDFASLRSLAVRGVIVTAKANSDEFDIVSRFFAPGAGINEDPVTGSAHCALTPYWANKLGKTQLRAYQASARGGILHCTLSGDRVRLAGNAITVLRGELSI